MEVLKIALVRLIDIIVWIIIAKSIMSWFPGVQDSRLYALLDDFTEPVEAPMRKLLSRFNRYVTYVGYNIPVVFKQVDLCISIVG